jgi:hypothetical protein
LFGCSQAISRACRDQLCPIRELDAGDALALLQPKQGSARSARASTERPRQTTMPAADRAPLSGKKGLQQLRKHQISSQGKPPLAAHAVQTVCQTICFQQGAVFERGGMMQSAVVARDELT